MLKETVPMEHGDLYKSKGVDIDTLSEYERSSNISKVA